MGKRYITDNPGSQQGRSNAGAEGRRTREERSKEMAWSPAGSSLLGGRRQMRKAKVKDKSPAALGRQ